DARASAPAAALYPWPSCLCSFSWSLRGKRKGMHDALFGEIDLEGVVLVGMGTGDGEISGLSEGLRTSRCTGKRLLSFERAPWFGCYASEREPGGLDGCPVHLDPRGYSY